MLRLIAIAAGVVVGAVALAEQPMTPAPAEVAKLVAQLGSEDFAEREAATRRLEEIGPAAIDELRTATTSDNPEAARRASVLLRKAERRLSNEKTLAPTLVELDAKDRPLDDVLADLSKQAGCEVVLGGLRAEKLAAARVGVSTGGKVPFWSAVLKVCDAAELQVASAGGFLAPGAMPLPRARDQSGARAAKDANRAVVLEARDGMRRPAFVRGAVLVEAVAFPKDGKPDQPSVLLQAWPEPRLQWERSTELKVVKAVSAGGGPLVAEPAALPPVGDVMKRMSDGTVLVRNADGGVSVIRDPGSFAGGTFRPNVRQAVVRFKPPEKPEEVAKELALSLYASVRGGVEPLAVARGLEPNKRATGGSAGVDLAVTYRKDENGKLVASVELAYDARAVHPAGVTDDLPGARLGGVAAGNNTVYGIRVTDADGKPFTLGLTSGANQFDRTGRVLLKLQLELHPDKGGQGPPAAATFWGTTARQAEVAGTLRDVPLAAK